MPKSFGTIRYSPKLLGGQSEKWWVVLDCDEELSKYYRHLYKINAYNTKVLLMPAWKSHITIVRNEEPSQKEPWERHAGCIVEFDYSSEVETNGAYFWLPVTSDYLLDFREELGLPRNPLFPLHLSIGHLNEL